MRQRTHYLVAVAVSVMTGVAWAGPRADYALECGGCHLPDGSGMAPEVPDMRGIIGHMVKLPEGRAYLARVPGAAQSPLSDAALARVLNWSLETFAAETMPRDFAPYDAKEVGRLRENVIERPIPARAALVEKLTEAGLLGSPK
ncbi:hypothetical protein [Arhodomonas sp. AD133]|uniref:hypothetical protein n=1 Tax=Arhodomonas sp. AD133 TaxID=3415009 RepID=UPI003EC054E1